jgi:hypothetical protein
LRVSCNPLQHGHCCLFVTVAFVRIFCLLLQPDMESLEPIQGMPHGMYHRYGVLDEDMEDDEDDSTEHAGDFSNSAGNNGSGGMYNADLLVAGMAGLGVHDPAELEADAVADAAAGASGEDGVAVDSTAAGGQGNWSLMAHPGECAHGAPCMRGAWVALGSPFQATVLGHVGSTAPTVKLHVR